MKSKVVAAILAWFVGWLGIHRFYLGQTGKGILYLVFFWTFIPAIVSFFDAILFLVMDEDKFNRKYNSDYIDPPRQQPTVVVHNHGQASPRVEYGYDRPASRPAGRQEAAEESFPSKDPFEQEGDRLYKSFDFAGAIPPYNKSLELRKHNPKLHFKLACLHSLQEKPDIALFHLEKAIEYGFYDFERIDTHDHLSYLRAQPEFLTFKQNGYKRHGGPATEPPVEDRLELDNDLIGQIERLAKLKEAGILSETEFTQEKQRLLR